MISLRPGPVAAAGFVALVAVVETTNALVAPSRAPTDTDWSAASAEVRTGFRPGDLVVAAPAWADPVVRLHLGDLVPLPIAGRLDEGRFARIWEVSQRGARAPEMAGAKVVRESNHGRLTLRLAEKTAAQVTFDFLERWKDARVVIRAGGGDTFCGFASDRFSCPGSGGLRPRIVEVDGQLKRALLAPPPAAPGALLVIEYPPAALGREIALGVGLHNVWSRKWGGGTAEVKVLVEGQAVLTLTAGNETRWLVGRADTSRWAGRIAIVRFEISSSDPKSRELAFAAEARDP